MMKFSLVVLFMLQVSVSFSQTGGNAVFALLDLPFNARSAGLGGNFISVKDQDLNLAFMNPSLFNKSMHQQGSFNHGFFANGVNYGMVNYGRSFSDTWTGGVALRYMSYGQMTRRDQAGNELGTFSSGEFVASVGGGKQLNERISVGANLNLLFSQLEQYNSFGTSIDLGATYESKEDNLLVTVLVRNAGYQFDTYTKGNRGNLPTQFQLAVSHKLKYAPFRFSLLAHHLNRWDISYFDPKQKPTVDPLTGDTIPVPRAGFGKKLAHHFTYQVEVLISKNLHARLAFDYHRRQEMRLANRPGLSGFSAGFGMNFKRFSIDYGFMAHSVAGFTNSFSLTTNFDKWKK
jgi:hypothetical protein